MYRKFFRSLLIASILIPTLSVGFADAKSPMAEIVGLKKERRGLEFMLKSRSVDEKQFELGQMLFHDKILSGNKNISCAGCHHMLTRTGDALSLSVGEGGEGLAIGRSTGEGDDAIHKRVPRNAPSILNLGLVEFGFFNNFFWDGRLFPDANEPSGFFNPAGDDLPNGLVNQLAVQAMFPVQSGAEMAGQSGENSIADAAAVADLAGPNGVWAQLAQRLRDIPEYVDLFVEAFDGVNDATDITYVHAANAIAVFEGEAGLTMDSPFDRYLLGDRSALSTKAMRGMRLFFGQAGCSRCHSGVLLTDDDFHAAAVPQIGTGKGDGFMGRDDFGLERVTGDPADRYKFRTPTLRNVALTGPWGHDGAFGDLRDMVKHMLRPIASFNQYDISQAVLPSRPDLDAGDVLALNDPATRMAAKAAAVTGSTLPLSRIDLLMEFLHSLTDPSAATLEKFIPSRVPSGLSLAE